MIILKIELFLFIGKFLKCENKIFNLEKLFNTFKIKFLFFLQNNKREAMYNFEINIKGLKE